MFNTAEVKSILRAEGINVVGDVVQDPTAENHFFVHIAISRDSKNLQNPSNRTLNAVRDKLHEKGVRVELLLNDEYSNDIEIGVRATLLNAFGYDLRNVFLSSQNNSVQVWLEPKHNIHEKTRADIERKVRLFLEAADLRLEFISVTNGENLPGKLALLKVLRKIAPANVIDLRYALEAHQFAVPSNDWLNRRLDALRKSAQVNRLPDGRYVLPIGTLQNLGTEKQGNRSPDVSRLLALARKG